MEAGWQVHQVCFSYYFCIYVNYLYYYLYIMSQMQFCFVNWARSGTLFLRNQSSLSPRWLKCWEIQLPLCLVMAASLYDHSRIFAIWEAGLESSVHGDAPCSSLWELSVPWDSAHFPRTPHLFTGPLLVGAGQVPTCRELSHTCPLTGFRELTLFPQLDPALFWWTAGIHLLSSGGWKCKINAPSNLVLLRSLP